ncbi:MAG: hypothetical protein ABWX65_00205 [Mycetocola sp.]
MPRRDTLVRSLHDIGLAAWFGGTLMGTIGLNGGAASAASSDERLTVAARGWSLWAPVQWAAIVVHGIGGIGLIRGNKLRLAGQLESRRNAGVKAAITGLAVASSAGSAIAGKVMSDHSGEATERVTEPSASASTPLRRAQRIQRVLQWTTPALTAVLIVLAAQQGEQQRPIKGLFRTTLDNFRH